MRLIGLDLGTKTLGVSITDKTRTITKPLEVIRFDFENYDKALFEESEERIKRQHFLYKVINNNLLLNYEHRR